jgi:hypothetical protein
VRTLGSVMGSEELRALQTPLKERYRADPEVAVVTLSATGELGDGISCSVRTGAVLASARHSPASNRALLRGSPDAPALA